MSRPRKPTELLKIKKTYEPGKHGKRIDDTLPMLTKDDIIDVPESITDDKVKSLWSMTTNRLIGWQILSDIDLPEVEEAFLVLQELQKINTVLKNMDIKDADYERYFKLKLKAINMFHAILKNYGLSPVERSKLTLTAIEIKKSESILDRIKKGTNE